MSGSGGRGILASVPPGWPDGVLQEGGGWGSGLSPDTSVMRSGALLGMFTFSAPGSQAGRPEGSKVRPLRNLEQDISSLGRCDPEEHSM